MTCRFFLVLFMLMKKLSFYASQLCLTSNFHKNYAYLMILCLQTSYTSTRKSSHFLYQYLCLFFGI